MSNVKHNRMISKRLPIMISFCFIILLITAMVVTYGQVEHRMVTEYERLADGVTNLMIEEVDPHKMDYYIEENYSSPEYLKIMKRFYELRDNCPDVVYMYIYRFYKDENGKPWGTQIFDLEDEYTETPNQISIDWVGGKYDVLEPFASLIDKMLTERAPVFEAAFSPEDGYLLSFAKPIYDENDNYIATACVDFSMDTLHKQNIHFIIVLAGVLISVSCVVLIAFILLLRRVVTNPLLSISKTVSRFKYDTEADLNNNLELLSRLGLNSNNEIGILYNALLAAEKDSLYYRDSYSKAEDEIHDKDIRINELGNLALRDSMTSVGNKAAFTASVQDLHDNDQYGIIMMDVNNLKMINDTYGHDAGDEYIIGTCRELCDVFSHSPVFRIGGDEFAVILKGRDFVNRDELFNKLTENFDRIWKSRENDPIHRYSGSLGMADSTTAKTPREAIKAADEAMYISKKEFKETYGSYR